MNRHEKDPSQSETGNSQTTVLANWLAVVTDFHSLYSQLSYCLGANPDLPVVSIEATHWVGQCHASQIKALLTAMHHELAAMLNDADQFQHLTRQEGYEHLNSHSAHLDQLNQRARTLLRLTSLTTG